jgi:hypothetical protein
MSDVKHMKIDEIQPSQFVVTYKQPLSDREKLEQINSVDRQGKPYQKYYIETKIVYQSQKVQSDCNDITFINQGTTNVNVADVLLLPNQSLRISGNRGELDTTQYTIVFAKPINTGNYLTILRKLYV